MKFCPKCGSILIPKKSGKKIILKCSCGYSTKNKEEIILKEKIHLPKIRLGNFIKRHPEKISVRKFLFKKLISDSVKVSLFNLNCFTKILQTLPCNMASKP